MILKKMMPAMLDLDIIPQFDLDIKPLDTIPGR